MSRQADLYTSGFGDNWYNHNKNDLGNRDCIIPLIETLNLKISSALEIGCSNGWRLKRMREKFGCTIKGIDPSHEAILASGEPENFLTGLAQDLPYEANQFDMAIFGFCLYVIDPEDWFTVIGEASRVIKDGGYIAVTDFLPTVTHKRLHPRYAPDNPVYMTFFDWGRFITSHPCYKALHYAVDFHLQECTFIIQKKINGAITEVVK